MAALDGEKKKLIGQAGVGVNPVELVRVAPVTDAIPMSGKVAVDVSGFMGTVVDLARGAAIAVPKPGADAKPVPLDV